MIDLLPPDLVLEIFRCLEISEILKCAQVSKRWYGFSKSEAFWKEICAQFLSKGEVDCLQERIFHEGWRNTFLWVRREVRQCSITVLNLTNARITITFRYTPTATIDYLINEILAQTDDLPAEGQYVFYWDFHGFQKFFEKGVPLWKYRGLTIGVGKAWVLLTCGQFPVDGTHKRIRKGGT